MNRLHKIGSKNPLRCNSCEDGDAVDWGRGRKGVGGDGDDGGGGSGSDGEGGQRCDGNGGGRGEAGWGESGGGESCSGPGDEGEMLGETGVEGKKVTLVTVAGAVASAEVTAKAVR